MSARTMMLLTALGLAVQTFADVSVTNVTCRQRYPWNGLVDIDYEIVSDRPDALFWVYPKGTDNWLGKRVIMNTLYGDGATNAVGVGQHRMVWDAKADMPKYHTKDLQITLQVIEHAAPYLVVDVSGGPDALFYPQRYSTEGPDISDDKCRRDEIWLRFILPGTFMMGSPTNELGHEEQELLHKVVLTKPYYMCIFEVTEKQWYNVMGGDEPSAWHGADCKPVEKLWTTIRGGTWPSSHAVGADTFMDRIRKKTKLTWDLPTEAQWEYACRAGTTTSLNTGKEVTGDTCDAMDEVGRYKGNQNVPIRLETGLTVPVGSYLPNNWGLYDMHGNVREFCLDIYNANTYSPLNEESDICTDPVGWLRGTFHVIRGGGAWMNSQSSAIGCRSARRCSDELPPHGQFGSVGFRPVILSFE